MNCKSERLLTCTLLHAEHTGQGSPKERALPEVLHHSDSNFLSRGHRKKAMGLQAQEEESTGSVGGGPASQVPGPLSTLWPLGWHKCGIKLQNASSV